MDHWKVRCYLSKECDGPIHAWRAEQRIEVRVALDVAIDRLTKRRSWTEPPVGAFRELRDDDGCGGLGEIRFYWDDPSKEEPRQYRALGYRVGDSREFLILLIKEKHDRPPFDFYRTNCGQAKSLKAGSEGKEEEHGEYCGEEEIGQEAEEP